MFDCVYKLVVVYTSLVRYMSSLFWDSSSFRVIYIYIYFFLASSRLFSPSRFISCHFHDYIPCAAIFFPAQDNEEGDDDGRCFYICSVVLELWDFAVWKTFHRVTRYRALISYQRATRKGNREKSGQIRPSHKWTPIKLLYRKGIFPLIFFFFFRSPGN